MESKQNITVESLAATVEALTKAVASLAESVPNAIKDGMTMAGVAGARTTAPAEASLARARANLGGPRCPKCYLPAVMCGGPEMVLVKRPKLDESGKPIVGKDGKELLVEVRELKTDKDGKPLDEDCNHVRMVVLPQDATAARFFQGIRLGGRVFASKHPNHQILVPRRNDFPTMLQAFGDAESDFREGGNRMWHWEGVSNAHRPNYTKYMRPRAPFQRRAARG